MYGILYDRLNRQKAMDGMETVSFDGFLKFTIGNRGNLMSLCVMFLEQYLTVICMFSYDANDKGNSERKSIKSS